MCETHNFRCKALASEGSPELAITLRDGELGITAGYHFVLYRTLHLDAQEDEGRSAFHSKNDHSVGGNSSSSCGGVSSSSVGKYCIL